MTRLRQSALLFASLLLITGCWRNTTNARQQGRSGDPGTWPVARVVDTSGTRTSFYPVDDAGWQSLVDTSVLSGFRPGMTGEDAVRTVGEADEHYDSNGELYWVYQRPGAAVVVARKRKASLFGGWWWRLEARYDPPVSPADLFHASVIKELPDDLERHTVTIMNKDSEGRIPAAWVYIEDGKVVKLDVSASGATGAPLGQSPDLG